MPAESSAPHRAVLLDALGTLIQLDEPWPVLVAALRERHAVGVALADARRAMLAEMSHYRRYCIRAKDASSLAQLRLECAEILRAQLQPALDDLSSAELVATLLDSLHFTVFDDVRSALERWRAAGQQTIVVSNWDISLHDVLRATGLRALVDGVVCSAEVGASKPDPAVFVAALELADLGPERAVHIGDSLEEDVAGARAAGIEPVLLRRGPRAGEPPAGVQMIASLRQW